MVSMRTHRQVRAGIFLALLCVCVVLCACGSVTYGTSAGGGQTLQDRLDSGLSIRAERGSKTLDITRATPGGTQPKGLEEDTWSVFVYLCGSDLETKGAAATADLAEMVGASGSDRVSFVVQTGGAKSWRNKSVSPRKLGRYLIQDGSIMDVGSTKAANMGDPATLSDFLTWGVENYPADHMGVILWDHGGGSIPGACFDELNSSDSLSLREIDQAFATTYATMWDKFEFVGFDACLMSTLETANVLASYADYMVASQESEPAKGWEYSSIMEYLAQHPSCTGAQVGREICNAYLEAVDSNSRGFATLAVTDLSQIDQLMQDFYRFSQEMYESGEDQGTLAAMSRGIQRADSYGSNNRREGYTNMVDLGGVVDACSAVTPSAEDVQNTLNKAITYQVRGTYHAGASGLSLFYPLKVNTKRELAIFETVAVNPSYLSYVDRVAHGATYNGGEQYQQYTSDEFWENNIWNWLLGNAFELEQQTQDDWNYVDDHTDTSTQITFAYEPQVDEEGTFWFQFDQQGIDNASVVSGLVYELSEDGKDLIALGETYDVYGQWETGEFADNFDGKWLALPDGQSLNLAVEGTTDGYIVYTSPILLNGTECYLRLTQNIEDGSVEVEGAWTGVSQNGAVDRNIVKIKKGDVIVPLYNAFSNDESVTAKDYQGDEYKVTSNTLKVTYEPLPEGSYRYAFCITDAFGDSYYTGSASFGIDPDGTVYAE